MIFTWCYILYYIYICIVSYIYIILIVLRPPCKQQTISFESWNLNSERQKNDDWGREAIQRKTRPLQFPPYSPINYRGYKTRRGARIWLQTCERVEEGFGVCVQHEVSPGILFPYALPAQPGSTGLQVSTLPSSLEAISGTFDIWRWTKIPQLPYR